MDETFAFPLTSIGGVVVATMFLVAVFKGVLGRTPGLQRLPIWSYAVAISAGLTAFSAYVIHTLPGEPLSLIWQAIVAAALASGFREWWLALDKPASESSAAQRAPTASTGDGGPTIVGSLVLMGLLGLSASGCAGLFASQPSQDQQQAKLRELKQAGLVVEQAGLVAEAAQIAEIRLHDWGEAQEAACMAFPDADPVVCARHILIPRATHDTIQASFKRASQAVQEALTAMKDLTLTDAARRAALDRALAAFETMLNTDVLGIDDPTTRAYIRAGIGAARIVLMSVLPLLGGGAS